MLKDNETQGPGPSDKAAAWIKSIDLVAVRTRAWIREVMDEQPVSMAAVAGICSGSVTGNAWGYWSGLLVAYLAYRLL